MKKIVLFVFCLFSTGILGFAQHWSPNHQYNSAMNIIGYVTIDGIEAANSTYFELGSFIDGECRDVYYSSDGWDEEGNDGVMHWCLIPTISADPEEANKTITFKLWDGETEYEAAVTATWSLENEGCLGCDGDFFEFAFTTPTPQPTVYYLPIEGYGAGNPGGYYLIASPVTVDPAEVEGDPQGMTEGNFDLYYFDNSKEDEWINWEGGDGHFNIVPGKGYLYAREEDAELELSGEPYEGDGQFDLAYSTGNPSADMRGWNLVGNPFTYAATVDKDAFYIMNEEGRNDIIVSTETTVAPMQGIFVLATEAGQTVKFTQAPPQPLGKVVLNLNRNRGTVIDRAIVRLGEGGTLPKFMLNPRNTKIYIEQGGDDYAVVSSNEDEIPVSFKAASNGTYTLNVAVQNAELDYLHLVDNLAGTDTDLLANPNYTFEANTGDYASRFTLVLRNTTGLVEHFAFYNGHNWTISNDGEALIQVVDVMGRILNSKEICGNAEINISQPAGVYMLRLVNGNDVKVQKVVVR